MKIFNKAKQFVIALVKHCIDDDLISVSNELTYKLILAIFPFIIFAMSLIGFFNLDGNYLLLQLDGALPDQIYNLLAVFVAEVVNEKSPGILSVSLLVSIFSSSSGLNAIIRGINKAYGVTDHRNFLVQRLVSIMLTLIFAVVLTFSAILLVFRDKLAAILLQYLPHYDIVAAIFSFAGYSLSLVALFFTIIIIYKFSCDKKIKLTDFVPGALVTVVIWTLAGKVYNIYINNFSNYSKVYGSIASVFILMFWLNLISFALLLGSEVNALLTFED